MYCLSCQFERDCPLKHKQRDEIILFVNGTYGVSSKLNCEAQMTIYKAMIDIKEASKTAEFPLGDPYGGDK